MDVAISDVDRLLIESNPQGPTMSERPRERTRDFLHAGASGSRYNLLIRMARHDGVETR
jgi:hypothetical protein